MDSQVLSFSAFFRTYFFFIFFSFLFALFLSLFSISVPFLLGSSYSYFTSSKLSFCHICFLLYNFYLIFRNPLSSPLLFFTSLTLLHLLPLHPILLLFLSISTYFHFTSPSVFFLPEFSRPFFPSIFQPDLFLALIFHSVPSNSCPPAFISLLFPLFSLYAFLSSPS